MERCRPGEEALVREMIGDSGVLRHRFVGLPGANVEIAQGVGGVRARRSAPTAAARRGTAASGSRFTCHVILPTRRLTTNNRGTCQERPRPKLAIVGGCVVVGSADFLCCFFMSIGCGGLSSTVIDLPSLCTSHQCRAVAIDHLVDGVVHHLPGR